jgi:hypothetical protein
LGGWGRAALDDNARLPFWEGSHCSDRNIQFIQVILKTSKGEAEGLPWLHSKVKVLKKKKRKRGAESLQYCPPPHPCPTRRSWTLHIVIGSYVSSLCPILRLSAFRIVVGPYASSSDPPASYASSLDGAPILTTAASSHRVGSSPAFPHRPRHLCCHRFRRLRGRRFHRLRCRRFHPPFPTTSLHSFPAHPPHSCPAPLLASRLLHAILVFLPMASTFLVVDSLALGSTHRHRVYLAVMGWLKSPALG